MAKFYCQCGEIIRVSGNIPKPIEWKLLSDTDFDHFSGQINSEDLYLACTSAFRCPTCDRLWIFRSGLDQDPTCYAPESPEVPPPTDNR